MKSDDNIRLEESIQYDETNLEYIRFKKKKLETKLLGKEQQCQTRIQEHYTKTGKLPLYPYYIKECNVKLPKIFRCDNANRTRLEQDWNNEFDGRLVLYPATTSSYGWDNSEYSKTRRAALLPEYARVAFEKEFSKKN